MTKLTLVVAALVAAAAYTGEASARNHAASRHTQAATTAQNTGDCVRAPNLGAYASDPYTQPPCMPNAGN